jgi:hypothetical protein
MSKTGYLFDAWLLSQILLFGWSDEDKTVRLGITLIDSPGVVSTFSLKNIEDFLVGNGDLLILE